MTRLPITAALIALSSPALAAPCVYGGNVPAYVGCIGQQASDALDLAMSNALSVQESSDIRYAVDGGPATLVATSAPYHMTLTTASAGTSVPIPLTVLDELCGDPDGCEIRVGMTNWSDAIPREAAANMSLHLYYSPTTGQWRDSVNNLDYTSGDGVIDHVVNAGNDGSGVPWDTCFVTDGAYSNYTPLTDPDRGIQLLMWDGYTGTNRTCEFTLID